MERDQYMWKDTNKKEKGPIKETNICEKSPIHVKVDTISMYAVSPRVQCQIMSLYDDVIKMKRDP